MTNAELIEIARHCSTVTNPMDCEECPFKCYWFDENEMFVENILKSSSDALEAAEKRIATYQSDVADLEQREKELNAFDKRSQIDENACRCV